MNKKIISGKDKEEKIIDRYDGMRAAKNENQAEVADNDLDRISAGNEHQSIVIAGTTGNKLDIALYFQDYAEKKTENMREAMMMEFNENEINKVSNVKTEIDAGSISEAELEKVSGGSHLSSDEVSGLKTGEILILENLYGEDFAKAIYLGDTRDPGLLSMKQCRVRIIEILRPDYYEDKFGDVPSVSAGIFGNANIHQGTIKHGRLFVGDEIYVSRYNLDYEWRA